MITDIPPWLQSLVDQRLALIEQHLPPAEFTIVMTPLVEPAEDTKQGVDFWERCCDNCQRYCPPDTEFYTGSIQERLRDGRMVVMTYGVCPSCKTTFKEK